MPPPAKKHLPGLLLWGALLAAVVGVALFISHEPTVSRYDDQGRILLLDTWAHLRSDGTEFAFVLREASVVHVQVHLAEGLRGRAALGRPAPSKPRAIAYHPDPEDATTFDLEGPMEKPYDRILLNPGVHTIRVDPIPDAKDGGAGERSRVRAVVRATPLDR